MTNGGETIVLTAGSSSATIVPHVGGRLGQLDLGDGPVLRGPDATLEWIAWGCYPLLPWSNRIPDGRIALGGLDARVPVNWVDGSAIHGLVASSPWSVLHASNVSARLETQATVGPYAVRGSQAYELSGHALSLTLSMVNIGDTAVPAGLGIHPWFRAGPLRLPADERWPGEPLPTGPPVAVSATDDLRRGAVPSLMDRCYTALTSNAADVPGVRLSWRGPVTQVVVYTGEPGWMAVEPVTMANDGFRLAASGMPKHGVQVVHPGGELTVTYRFQRPP